MFFLSIKNVLHPLILKRFSICVWSLSICCIGLECLSHKNISCAAPQICCIRGATGINKKYNLYAEALQVQLNGVLCWFVFPCAYFRIQDVCAVANWIQRRSSLDQIFLYLRCQGIRQIWILGKKPSTR